MPIYEYKCDKKGHTFEVMQRFSDDPIEVCEVCGAPVHRVYHPVAVHFKGKGFYSTDYGSKKRARELKDAAESKSSKDSSDGSSSDSKSDSKSESKSDSSKSDSGKSGSGKSDSNAPKSAAA